MITYHKALENKLVEIDSLEEDCWINCVAPTDEEIKTLIDEIEINPHFLRASLDPEESPRLDKEDEDSLVIIDMPVVKKEEGNITYDTNPLGIIVTQKYILTVSLTENSVIGEFSDGVIKNVYPAQKIQFMFRIMLRTAIKYLQYLKQIDKISNNVQHELRKSMKNRELIQLLEIENSLVYFSNSLKSNETTLERVMRGRLIGLDEDDKELLEDVLIELKQAKEMANIHMNILSGTMDAFASIISNNLNIVMKVMTSITLIFSIPTVISGIYGMNITGKNGNNILPFHEHFWFPMAIIGALMAITVYILKKKDLL